MWSGGGPGASGGWERLTALRSRRAQLPALDQQKCSPACCGDRVCFNGRLQRLSQRVGCRLLCPWWRADGGGES